jgi:hypothetical protein
MTRLSILSLSKIDISSLKLKAVRVREESRSKKKRLLKARGALYRGMEGGRKRILLEGTQAMPACLSDKDRMRVKKLGW